MNSKLAVLALAAIVGTTIASPLSAQKAKLTATTMVGGNAMYPAKDIIDNAVNSVDHTTLVAAVKAAGLVETLKGKGPFTVFAPVNNAFAALPAGTVESLLKPESKGTLTKILTDQVVARNWDAKSLMQLIKKGNGTAEIATVSGGKLWAMMNGPLNVVLKDENDKTIPGKECDCPVDKAKVSSNGDGTSVPRYPGNTVGPAT